ncbi:MAG: hypothetical protein ACOYVK_01305 [Bacillota bacterium]
MIQIDDAGSGSLIGGTCIGALRIETGEYYYDIIPLDLYTSENFSKKLYLDEVITISNMLFNRLNVSKDERIEVCRGYMFDKLRPWLKDQGFNYISTTIDNPLQTQIEESFSKYTIGLGLPYQFVNYTKYPFHFHRLLRWVYADYDNRWPLCKTGWKSWKKYGNLDINISDTIFKNMKYKCLKCGKPIENNSSAKVIKYISNKPNIIYLHSNC